MSTMTDRITPPLKWHGGKHYLARRIVGLMPPHLHYVEQFERARQDVLRLGLPGTMLNAVLHLKMAGRRHENS